MEGGRVVQRAGIDREGIVLAELAAKTRLLQTGQELRTASPPFAAFDVKGLAAPLMRSALPANPMKGMNPEPDALRQSAQ
jgi:hypothetical protein